MSDLGEKCERNPVTTEVGKKEWEFFEDTEATLRDQKHLEFAYEWLRRRGKVVLSKGMMEK